MHDYPISLFPGPRDWEGHISFNGVVYKIVKPLLAWVPE
jgi:hypothetical protein